MNATNLNVAEKRIEIEARDVIGVYSGRCGCRGTYRETARSVKLMLTKYAAATDIEASSPENEVGGQRWVSWANEENTRVFVIYYYRDATR